MAINFKLLQIFFCIFILNTAIEAAPTISKNTTAKVDHLNGDILMNENLDVNQSLQEVLGDFKEEIPESSENERKIRSELDTIDRAGFDFFGDTYLQSQYDKNSQNLIEDGEKKSKECLLECLKKLVDNVADKVRKHLDSYKFDPQTILE